MAGSLGKLQKIHTSNDEFNRFQDQLIAALAPLLSNPRNSGNLVKGIVLTNKKDNFINHGLGREYIGYEITRRYDTKGYIDIFESSTVNNSKDKFVIINCLDTMTCDLYVF